MPYLNASQSGVIPIALEYGLPIIASDTGGLKEQMDNGKFGLFCKPGNSDSLMEQMEYILKHPDLFQQEREKMSTYLQNLNWDIVTQKIIQI